MTVEARDFKSWQRDINRKVNLALRGSQGGLYDIEQRIEGIREEIGNIETGTGARPTNPVEVELTTSVILDHYNRMWGRIFADFPPVIFDIAGGNIEIQRYEMWGANITGIDMGTVLPEDIPKMQYMAAAGENQVFAPAPPGSTWRIAVLAVSAGGVSSNLSTVQQVTVVEKTTPPPIPSPLALTTNLGAVRADWDGLSAANEPMPIDFLHTEVAISQTSPPTEIVERLDLIRNFLVYVDGEEGSPVFMRHRAVDTSGNVSEWSAETNITPQLLVDRADLQNQFEQRDQAISDAVQQAQNAQQTFAQEWNTALGNVGNDVTGIQGSLTNLNDVVLPGIYNGTSISDDAISTRHLGAGSVDADQIAANAVTAAKVNVSSLAASVAFIDLLDTNLIQARLLDVQNARITGDMIVQGTLNAGHVVISDPSNMILDPRFETSWWFRSGSVTTGAVNGDAITRFAGPGNLYSRTFDTIPGAQYVLNFDSLRTGTVDPADDYYVWARGLDADENFVAQIDIGAVNFTGPRQLEFTIPTDATIKKWDLNWSVVTMANGTLDIWNPTLRRKSGGVLIVDGSISTVKLAAGSVVAEKLAAGAVEADKLAANAVTANKVLAGAITTAALAADAVTTEKLAAGSVTANIIDANALNGKLITGSTFRTNANASTVGGIQFDASRFRAWDSSGSLFLDVNPNNGTIDAVGEVRAGTANRYVAMRQSGSPLNFPRLEVMPGGSDHPGYIGVGSSGEQATPAGLLVMGSPRTNWPATRTRVALWEDGFRVGEEFTEFGLTGTYNTTTIRGRNGAAVESSGDGEVTIRSAAASGGPASFAAGRNPSAGLYSKIYTRSGASFSPNFYVDPNFSIVYRTSSLRKVKTNIRSRPDMNLPGVKRLSEATFNDRGSVERGEPAPLLAGLIADEVEELNLPYLLNFDEEGEPAGVNYDRLAVALLPWEREQDERLDDQEKRISALESQIKQLTKGKRNG